MPVERRPVGRAHGGTAFRPGPETEDRERLVARIGQGETEALAALYDGTAPLVNGLALRILREPEAAEEVTGDVYHQVWRDAARYDPARGTALAWLLTLTRSRAIDRRRQSARRERAEPIGVAVAMPSPAPGPEEDTAVRERRELVGRALARLPADQRRPIELAFFAGLSHTEIAAAVDAPLGTVKTRIRLGMTRLRQTLATAGRASL
jgi:RNA polymerase sigma-70 factor (ECF subfamily)